VDGALSDIAAVARISAVPTILEVVSESTGLRLALVARVTRNEWTACATLDRMSFGLNVGDKLEVTTTLCSEVRDSQQPIVIEHASQDPAFCRHPTPVMYGFESYMAFPIYRATGEYFGNLCALDSVPARLRDEKTISMMKLFAELISLQLTAEEEHTRDRAALFEERQSAQDREEFIAVLAHDLKTPLTAVVSGSEFLLLDPMPPVHTDMLRRIRDSGKRVVRLVDDLLDFARGRFGRGIDLALEETGDVDRLVRHVVAEVAMTAPSRVIRMSGQIEGAAQIDQSRVSQLVSNLIGNAVDHGPEDEPVDVALSSTPATIVVTVVNGGEPIAADVAGKLFHPFYRGNHASGQSSRGLGLGLFIASGIARAHGGTITLSSTAEHGTAFTMELPRSVDAAPGQLS
jgi:signal transduction histidine kinase